jgi:hypothetical protein
MFNVAVRVPVDVGVNSTLIVQLAPAARVPCSGLHIAGEFGSGTPKSAVFVPVIVKAVKVTVPVPVLVTVTPCGALVVPTVCELKVKLVGASVTVDPVVAVNVTVTVGVPVIETAQLGGFVCGLVGVQFALKPENVEPPVGVAVSTTWVPFSKFPEHVVAGQVIPAGLLVTVPVPVPASATVSVDCNT